MSKIFKKIGGSKIAITVTMNYLEIMGQGVAEKDMFCIHWVMKGLRGRESTGDSENVRAAILEGSSYPVARFPEVFTGEVHPKARKDGAGYDPMEFTVNVVSPALHKRDDKLVGKAAFNIFEKVPVLAAGQAPHESEQTVTINKEGNTVAHIKLTLAVKSGAPLEDSSEAEPVEQPLSSSAPSNEGLVVKTPPATPQKESEAATSATSDVAEETESKKSRHRKRHSSNSSAMYAAQLKTKESELKQKDEELNQLKEELSKKNDELMKLEDLQQHNVFLESRVKELEQANEKTDVVPLDPMQQKMQDDLARLQEDKERLEDDKQRLADELEAAKKEIEDLKKNGGNEQKKEFDLMNQQLAALQEELLNAKKEISDNDKPAASASSGIMMQAIIAAVGAVLGIIIGHLI